MTTTQTGLKIESVTNTGFRPTLHIVPAGSYATANYGSSAVPLTTGTSTYNSVLLEGSSNSLATSGCNIRQDGNLVSFELSCVLDLTQADPTTNAGELRLKVKDLAAGDPNKYGRGLSPVSGKYPFPVFPVEISIQSTSGAAAPTLLGVANEYQARLLANGELALVGVDSTAIPSVVAAITAANITGSFGAAAGTADVLKIFVKGTYRNQA